MGARRPGRIASALVAIVLAAGWTMAGLALPAEAASSWKTVRSEEFSGSSLPDGCGEYTGKYVGGASVWKADDVQLKGGLLRLKLEQRKAGGRKYTSGGVGCWGWAQKYGRYEVRAKIPQGKGIDSYMTLFPTKASESAWTGIELLAPGSETAYVTNGYGKKSETARVAGDYSDTFHTYVIEWAPKHLRMTVDGDEIFYSTKAYTGSRWFGLVVSNGDTLTGVPDADTKLPAQFQIDSVKVSSYTGVKPKASTADEKLTAQAAPSPEPSASASRMPVPATTAPVTQLEPELTSSPAIAGGVWPWLLGGSLIAASAALLLTYPNRRHERRLAARDKLDRERLDRDRERTGRR